MNWKIFLAAFAVVLIILACKKDKALPPECSDEVSFAADVQPIIELNCTTAGCHDASASGGYDLTSYSSIAANGEKVLHVINHDAGYLPMPQGADKLPDTVIRKIECWVKQGKLDN